MKNEFITIQNVPTYIDSKRTYLRLMFEGSKGGHHGTHLLTEEQVKELISKL